MKEFTIYTANCTGNAKNCIYHTEVAVKDIASLARAMRHDHVCAMYRDHKRSAAGSSGRTVFLWIATMITARILRSGKVQRM